MSASTPDSASCPSNGIEATLFVRLRVLRGEADLELNGKTGWIAPSSLLVRVIPDSPDAGRFAQEAAPVLAEVCYSSDQRVIPIEAIIAQRDVRAGYLKLLLDVREAHPRLLGRWETFVARFSEYLTDRRRREH